jgi:hypothetical protein
MPCVIFHNPIEWRYLKAYIQNNIFYCWKQVRKCTHSGKILVSSLAFLNHVRNVNVYGTKCAESKRCASFFYPSFFSKHLFLRQTLMALFSSKRRPHTASTHRGVTRCGTRNLPLRNINLVQTTIMLLMNSSLFHADPHLRTSAESTVLWLGANQRSEG